RDPRPRHLPAAPARPLGGGRPGQRQDGAERGASARATRPGRPAHPAGGAAGDDPTRAAGPGAGPERRRPAGPDRRTGAGAAVIALAIKGPPIDWAGLSPLLALIGGSLVVLLVGLLSSRTVRERVVPALTIASLGATLGLTIWQWHDKTSIISGALRVDDLAMVLCLVFLAAGLA